MIPFFRNYSRPISFQANHWYSSFYCCFNYDILGRCIFCNIFLRRDKRPGTFHNTLSINDTGVFCLEYFWNFSDSFFIEEIC